MGGRPRPAKKAAKNDGLRTRQHKCVGAHTMRFGMYHVLYPKVFAFQIGIVDSAMLVPTVSRYLPTSGVAH